MDETSFPRALSGLIGSIYDCAIDPELWDRTLLDIRDTLNCYTALLMLVDVPQSRFLISKTVGIPAEVLERQETHVPEITQIMDTYGSSLGPDEPFVAARLIPAAVWEQSTYIRECLKPYGTVDIVQYLIMRTPTRFAPLGFARHRSQGIVTERELQIGGLLLPHLRRALTISNLLDARTIERARMAEALDALRCGVILANEHGAILHANDTAEHMLRDGGALQGSGGVLGATSPDATQELRKAIRLAARDEAALGKTGLAVKLTDGETPLFAHVLSMNGSEIRTRLQPEAVAAVFIGAPEVGDAATLMATAFELAGQARVLSGLLAGRTLAKVATDIGVTYATARTHLEAIFSKTGVKRQAELMRLAARFVPPASPAS